MTGRRGMALVMVMAVLLITGFFAMLWFNHLQGETGRTVEQSRHVQATALGEAVAARIAALVAQHPWSERFYRKLGNPQTGVFTFDETTFPGALTHDSYGGQSMSMRGIVSDLAEPGSYRIKLAIDYNQLKVYMSWDKVYPTDALNMSSDDGTALVTPADQSADPSNAMIDALRDAAKGNRPAGDLPPALRNQAETAIVERRNGKNPARALLGQAP